MFDSKKIGITSTKEKDMEDEVVLTIYNNDLNDQAGNNYSNSAFEGDESTKNDLMPNRFEAGNNEISKQVSRYHHCHIKRSDYVIVLYTMLTFRFQCIKFQNQRK